LAWKVGKTGGKENRRRHSTTQRRRDEMASIHTLGEEAERLRRRRRF
jgi:hypothetical protein